MGKSEESQQARVSLPTMPTVTGWFTSTPRLSKGYGVCCSANFRGVSPKTLGSPTDRSLTRCKMRVANMARHLLSQYLLMAGEEYAECPYGKHWRNGSH